MRPSGRHATALGIFHAALAVLSGQAAAEIRQTMLVTKAPAEAVNGRYEPSAITDDGRPCYKKEDDGSTTAATGPLLLCLNARGYWVLQPEAALGTDQAYMRSTVANMMAPQTAGPWLMPQNSVWGPTEIDVSPATRAVAWSLTTATFGGLLCVTVFVWLGLSHHPRVRDTCFGMANMAFTVFSAFMLACALHKLLFEGFPKTIRRSPFMEISISTAIFCFCYAFMLLACWKFQYSPQRLAGAQYLGSCITAFVGITVADLVQRVVVKLFPAEMTGSGLTDFQAEMLGAVIVCAVSWLFLALCRQASLGIRAEKMVYPPDSPWSKKRFLMPSASRMCGVAGAAHDKPAAASEGSDGDWTWRFEWAEDTAAVLIESYLINQTAFFVNTGKLPGLTEYYYSFGQGHNEFWVTCLVMFVVTFAISLRMRENQEGGRMGRTFLYSTAMATSWCLYRLLNFKSRTWCPDSHELQRMLAAVVITLACAFGMRAVSLRSSSDLSQASWNEQVFLVGLCAGNIVGVSWGNVFFVSIRYEVESWLGPQEVHEAVRCQCAFAVLTALLVAAAWWKVVLPRALLRLKDHESMINQEEQILDPDAPLMPSIVS